MVSKFYGSWMFSLLIFSVLFGLPQQVISHSWLGSMEEESEILVWINASDMGNSHMHVKPLDFSGSV